MSKYINVEKQLVRLYLLGLSCEDVVRQFLLTATAADVVEVVRCRDCEMWSDSFEVKDVGRRCLNFRIVTKPDFYCAWGSKE